MLAVSVVGDGRGIPVLILDTAQRPDVDELFRVHAEVRTGDHVVTWGRLPGREGSVALFLELVRPIELTVILEFDIERQGGLVDAIIRARCVYLQPGRLGDRLALTLDNPRILVSIGDLGFDEDWDKTFRKHLVERLRREGLGRPDAKRAVSHFLNEWRQFTGVRAQR